MTASFSKVSYREIVASEKFLIQKMDVDTVSPIAPSFPNPLLEQIIEKAVEIQVKEARLSAKERQIEEAEAFIKGQSTTNAFISNSKIDLAQHLESSATRYGKHKKFEYRGSLGIFGLNPR